MPDPLVTSPARAGILTASEGLLEMTLDQVKDRLSSESGFKNVGQIDKVTGAWLAREKRAGRVVPHEWDPWFGRWSYIWHPDHDPLTALSAPR